MNIYDNNLLCIDKIFFLDNDIDILKLIYFYFAQKKLFIH